MLQMPHVMLQFDMGTWGNNRPLGIVFGPTQCKMIARGVNMQDTPVEHVKLQKNLMECYNNLQRFTEP